MPLNLPNILTLLRVAAIPVMVVMFYLSEPWATWGAAWVFVLAAVTDWFDGWLARRQGLTTAFGAFLDPVADKLIVATALVLLVDRFETLLITLSACVVIGREIVVSALREWMAQLGERASVAVSQVAKVKTALQMVAIGMLLTRMPDVGYRPWFWLGEAILIIAVILTLWSMVVYLRVFAQVVARTDGR